jgi:hypothetical protein
MTIRSQRIYSGKNKDALVGKELSLEKRCCERGRARSGKNKDAVKGKGYIMAK